MMKLKLYEYSIEQSFDVLLKLLRSALGNKISKKNKDLRIAEAIGIIDAMDRMLLIDKEEDDESD